MLGNYAITERIPDQLYPRRRRESPGSNSNIEKVNESELKSNGEDFEKTGMRFEPKEKYPGTPRNDLARAEVARNTSGVTGHEGSLIVGLTRRG